MRPGLRQFSRDALSSMGARVINTDEFEFLDERKPSSAESSWRLDTVLAGAKAIIASEKFQVGLSAAGAVIARWLSERLRKTLLTEARFGPDKESFPEYSDFLRLFQSVVVIIISAAIFKLSHKKMTPTASIASYAGIASAAVLAVISERELSVRLGLGLSAIWKCPVIFVVMGILLLIGPNKFGWKEWGTGGVFVAGCIASSMPWDGLFSASASSGHHVFNFLGWASAIFFVLLYLGGEGFSMVYQEKMYRDHSMPVVDQVFFIFIFVMAMNAIGFLIGSHVGRVVGFIVDHPVVLLHLFLSSLPYVAMVFLMSFMMSLCGALMCSMISQVLALVIVFLNEESHSPSKTALYVLGLVLMLFAVFFAMLRMPHLPNQISGKDFFKGVFQLADDEETSALQLTEIEHA